MPVIKKYGDVLPTPLTNYGTFIKDLNANSTYFRITEFNETFTGGKNGFLIEGSQHLKESTEIKIQILDVNGDPIYFEPGEGIPEYYEGVSKVVAVYVYEDTPIGNAKITILGELKTYVDDSGIVRDIPEEWKNVYNVKWEKTFKVNTLLKNEDKVRFYKRPKVNITEIVKAIYANEPKVVTQTGQIRGVSVSPSKGQNYTNFSGVPQYYYQITDNSNWTGSAEGNQFTLDNGFSGNISEVITNKVILSNTPYVDSNNLVQDFSSTGYTASFFYTEDVTNLKTALTGSFAKINLSDLETFVGDVARVRIFRKSLSTISDFEFVQEIQLESNELLVDTDTSVKNQEFYGVFDSYNYKNYWFTSSNNITTDFNTNYLYNSVKLNSNGTNYYYTSQSFSTTKDVEYTLSITSRISASFSTGNYIRLFLSGSRESTYGGSTNIIGAEQEIIKITNEPQYLQKTTFIENFKAEEFIDPKLFIEVKGTDWYVSNISLRASQESSFSPNEITFIQSVPRSLERETFEYRFDFYDINNNYIPIQVTALKTFDGGNLQRIEKRLRLNPSQNYFQFDSGSMPVSPTIITFNIQKTLLTGSVNFTSQSIDFFGSVLSASMYPTGGFPGQLSDITASVPFMTVAAFTGSRADIIVQNVVLTGECEGVTDTVVITRLLDGFGGVNHIIRPYRGTTIRNSSTQSLEIQAVRIDGVNDIELYSGSRPERGWNLIQLHLLSGSFETAKFINLEFASSSGFVAGLTKGDLGTKEINFNAIFNRDSIDKKVTVYLMPSASAASGPAYITSASVLASLNLEDLQDGLDTPVVTYNADTFTVNYRNEASFRPVSASATASFYVRGTNQNPISASIEVYPSMSINADFVPEYWVYYVSGNFDSNISINAVDVNGNEIKSTPYSTFVGNSLTQSKILTTTFTYTEPYTLTQISIDKTFTIVPEGKPGDDPITFELIPSNLTLNANPKGIVGNYGPANTELKLKQGQIYLAFSSSKKPGTFWLNDITQSNIVSGNVNYTNTSSLLITSMSNLSNLSGSLTYNLLIHPYFTSSKYTQSLVQNFTKALDGPPPIEVLINPKNSVLAGNENGWVKSYTPASTNIQLKEGQDTLVFTNASTAPGTWRFISISGSSIQTGSITGNTTTTATVQYANFNPPYVSASSDYTILAYPYSLGPGHEFTNKVLVEKQTFTKNNDAIRSRSVVLAASSNVVNFDGDTVVINPTGPIALTATPSNTTSSLVYYQFFKYDPDAQYYEPKTAPPLQNTSPAAPGYDANANIYEVYPDEATSAGEVAVWRVEIRDGSSTDQVRAIGETTISGVRAGLDSFVSQLSNANASIQADIWDTYFTGSGTLVTATKAGTPLIHTSSYIPAQLVNYEYGSLAGLPIGYLGYYSASIYSKSNFITLAPQNRLLGNPASIPDVTGWTAPGNNRVGEVVYKVDFEGGRAIQYHTQSLNVQITPGAAYEARLANENSSVVYRVSGEMEFNLSDTEIRVFRGDVELTNTASLTPGQETHTDIYGNAGWKGKCRVSIAGHSAWITLGGGLGVLSHVPGTPATMPGIINWTSPETNARAEIIYKIQCEGREELFKTQSLAVQFEGNIGPGIVMRGVWSASLDYIGQIQTNDFRRDVVIWPDPATYNDETHFWAAMTGSGPGTGVGPQQPDNGGASAPWVDSTYWKYLGQEELFVAAQIAIFRESYVKNTLNVGTKDTTGAFANIVIAGGRPDPYIALGQTGTKGTAGKSGTTVTGSGVIGYNRQGIWLGIYENGAAGTTGRFSIKNSADSKGMYWDGDNLTIVGGIRQISPGVFEGRLMGAWAASTVYYQNDIVTYGGNSWTSNTNHTSTNDTNASTGYPGYGPWTIAPISAKLLRMSASSQVFIKAQNLSVSPDWIELTVNKQNISATTNWTTSPSVTLYNASSGGSTTTTGDTVYLRKADFGNNDLVEITATADSISDTITIAKVLEGSDGLTIILSNESHTLPASSAGVVSDYNGSGTNILIYQGATQLDYDGIGTANGKWTVSASPTNITVGAISDGGNYAVVGNHSNMTANLASVSFTMTGKKLNGDSFTITRVQSLSKSIAGAAGATGATGPVGAGVVYRGAWVGTNTYFYTSTRRDVVRGSNGTYYLANNTGKNGLATWGNPTGSADWTTFGAEFSSVATDILFSQDVYANRTVNVGASGSGPLIQLNSDFENSGSNPFISVGQTLEGPGYNKNGIFIGYDSGSSKMSLKSITNYLRWTGNALEVQGTIQATDGYLGLGNNVWRIDNALLYSSASVGQMKFNAARPAMEIYDSGSTLRVDINTNTSLSPITNISLNQTGSVPISTQNWPNVEYLISDFDTSMKDLTLEVSEGTYTTGSTFISYGVPQSADGATAVFTFTLGGSSYGSANVSAGSGYLTYARLTTDFGILAYYQPFGGVEELVGGSIATATSISGVGSGQTEAYRTVSYNRNISIGLTLKPGIYRFKPAAGNYEMAANSLSDFDLFPLPSHELTVENHHTALIQPGYLIYGPVIPSVTATTVNVATSKTEIIPGGLQVAFSQDRYVQIPRTTSGPMLKIGGGVEIVSDATNGITSPSGSVNIHGDLTAVEFKNYASSLTATAGYSKLVNGLIVQAGYASTAASTPANVAVSFPITFPNACLAVTCATARNASGANGYNHVTSVSTSGATLVLDAGGDGYWIAVGY